MNNDNRIPSSFIESILNHFPSWAKGSVATLIGFAILLQFIGIDYARPINTYLEVQTQSMKEQAQGIMQFNETAREIKNVMNLEQETRERMFNELTIVISRQEVIIETILNEIEENRGRMTVMEAFIEQNNARIDSLERNMDSTK